MSFMGDGEILPAKDLTSCQMTWWKQQEIWSHLSLTQALLPQKVCVSCELDSSMKPTPSGALVFDFVPAQAYIMFA